MNTGNIAVGLAMPQCMCQWQSTQTKSKIETVPAQGTLLPKHTWLGLTDEEVKHEWEVWRANVPRYAGFAKGIEAKLKQKNGFAEEKNT
jgi:hypothetical protein